MTTSSALTTRQMWTRSRGIVLAVVLLLIGAAAIAVVRSQTRHGDLDPRSADPRGSRAVAELLADRGVTTRVVTTLDAARSATGPDTTLLVAVPDLLSHRQQSRLATATTSSGGRTVLVAPSRWSVGRLAPGVSASPATTDATLDPDCSLPEARRAGSAETGGIRYTTTVRDAESCYPSERRATLLRVPATSGAGDTVVLGAPDILLNNRLDKQGNASLALQLLGSRPHLVWYLPSLADSSATGTDGRKSLLDLLPSGWLWGTLQLFVAALVTAFWRGRRFGPLVAERLPVAIRASETTEGRARLYRKADARDRASAALRATTRTRLAPLAGIPAAQAHTAEALLPALSARLPDHGEQALHSLLFGVPPRDDAALIALTDRLDALEREVRRS
ncbi:MULTISPECIES: DUF4350 domain-containing protein [unclassified Streptomyces]|uniref:DUF4350 domain-containing protein n=1 Tax=unclassified Streptomyces TaxID=2593676 RepID=UPI002E80C8C7|nr:DUF4350 domain-containing protein [Streptomyces sp. NBC_00566]WUB88465.1 DUF4350 domain-containing protein [Streptomyces sp. NBC_00566]